jgi:hypothetical protein
MNASTKESSGYEDHVSPMTILTNSRDWWHTRLYGIGNERSDGRYRELSALATIDATEWPVLDHVDDKIVEDKMNVLRFDLTEFMHSSLEKDMILLSLIHWEMMSTRHPLDEVM